MSRRTKKSKTCATCEKRKPINQPDHDDDGFGYQHNTADGYRPHCRLCIGDMQRKTRSGNGIKHLVETANAALTGITASSLPSQDALNRIAEAASAVISAAGVYDPDIRTVTICIESGQVSVSRITETELPVTAITGATK